jgi:hypothetical protein
MNRLPSSKWQFVEVLLEASSIDDSVGSVGSEQDRLSNFGLSSILLLDSSSESSVFSQILVDVPDGSIIGVLVSVDLWVVVPLSGLGVLSMSDIELSDFFGSEFSIEDLEGVPMGETMRIFLHELGLGDEVLVVSIEI